MITGVDHIGICVSNLKRSVEFYCRVLGFEMIDHTGFEDGTEAKSAMMLEDFQVDAAIVNVTGGGQLELLEFKPGADVKAAECPMNSVGKLHLALTIDDMDSMIDRLKAKNVEFSSNYLVDRMADDGVKWVYFKDPDGMSIELTERFGKIDKKLVTDI